MKQKTRFKNFGNIGIGYRPMNGWYQPQNSHISWSLVVMLLLVQ